MSLLSAPRWNLSKPLNSQKKLVDRPSQNLSYYCSNRNLSIVFDPEYGLKGTDFFSYTGTIFVGSLQRGWTPVQILSLGIVILMITPYMRVAASVIYFGLVKNVKYLSVTLFVLVVLTSSLLVH